MKKRGKRRTTRVKKVNRKEKNTFVVLILVLILVLFLLLAIQNPLTGNTITGQQVSEGGAKAFIDPVVDLFKGWTEGRIAESGAKILFLILVTLFIWSILDQFHLFGHGSVQGIIAVIVGFLSTVYIAPQDIWVILVSYNALGSTLLTMIPFAILALYTYRAVEDNNPKTITLQRVVWGMFTLFLVYFYISGLLQGKIESLSGYGLVYIIATVAAAVIFTLNTKFIHQLAKMHVEAMKETATTNIAKMGIGAQALRQTGEMVSGETPKGPGTI